MADAAYDHGIVLGKFMPHHHGHRLVIATASRRSRRVTLLVSVLPDDVIPPTQRVEWLRRLYPEATVLTMPVGWEVTDAQAWADGALAALGGQRPDAVFSSEDYGRTLSDLWGCEHVMVDRQRLQVPISSKAILADPPTYRRFLDPIVWRYFATRPEHGGRS